MLLVIVENSSTFNSLINSQLVTLFISGKSPSIKTNRSAFSLLLINRLNSFNSSSYFVIPLLIKALCYCRFNENDLIPDTFKAKKTLTPYY